MKIWVPEVVSAYQVGISSGFSRDFVSIHGVKVSIEYVECRDFLVNKFNKTKVLM